MLITSRVTSRHASQILINAANRLRLNPKKTELLWYGCKHSLYIYRLGGCGPAIKLGGDNIKASGHTCTSPWSYYVVYSEP